jgi:hypothetical protein
VDGERQRRTVRQSRIPNLEDRVVESLDQVSWKTEWDNDYDFRYTKHPALAN